MPARLCGIALLSISAALLSACDQRGLPDLTVVNTETGRWYSQAQQQTGQLVFSENCASCHGEQAQGLAADWRQRLEDGSFPPPPLNGTAHAWHHSLSVLLQVINEGGVALGGKMPPFAASLDDDQKLAAIAYFQSYWNDEIYQQWLQMGGVE